MDRQTIFKKLAEFVADNDSPNPEPLDNTQLWSVLLDVAANENKTLQIFYEIFLEYLEKVPAFRTAPSPELNTLIDTLNNTEKSLEERSKAAVPLIIITPFTTPEKAAGITRTSVEICQELINKENDIPIKFIDNFDDMMCSDMDIDNLDAVYDAFKAELATSNKVAALACMAPVAEDISGFKEDEILNILSYMNEAFKGDNNSKKAAALLLEYICGYFEHEEEHAPKGEDLAPTLISMMNDSDYNTAKRAERAFQSLIECHIITDEQTEWLLSLFPQFTTPVALKYYFKLLTCLANPEDDDCCCGDECCGHDHDHDHGPNLKVVQALVNFAKENYSNAEKSPLIRGHALDLLSILASLDPMFIEDIYKDALGVAKSLIDEKKLEAYVWLAPFLFVVSKCFEKESRPIIKDFLPVLLDAHSDDAIGTKKDKNNLLADICAILGEGFNDELVPKATDVVLALLKDTDLKSFFQGCACVIALRSKMGVEKATEAFKLLASRMDEMENEQDIGTVIHTLKKLIKKVSIDAALVQTVVDKIVKGDIKILKGRLPIEEQPPNAIYFDFLKAFIMKYPAKAADLCKTLIEWMKKASISAMEVLLSCIEAGLEVAAIKEEGAKEIAEFLKKFLVSLQVQDSNEIAASLACLTAINKAFPAALKPLDDVMGPILEFVRAVAEANEEEDYMMDSITAMPDVARFVFNVYTTDAELEINEDLLGSLVSMMPFSPDVEGVPELLQCLVDMLDDTDRFECIVVPTLKCFAELLLMKKSELEEFELEDDLVKAMKAILKSICKKKPAIGKQISKDYAKSRAKLNRFNALIR